MEDFEKKCKMECNDKFGRYVVAAVDIKAGETILLEGPVLITPFEEEMRCANCFKVTQNFCSVCHVFPLCDYCKQHNEFDCKLLANMTELRLESLQRHMSQIYGPLKSLLLRENKETEKYFNQLLSMEAHTEKRRNSNIWKKHENNVVEPLLKSGVAEQLSNGKQFVNAELLQRLCGLIDVNCFEIRGPEEAASMRGMYPIGALLAHSCVANVAVSINENYQMKMYANRDIKCGENVCNCYTNVLLGTDERRNSLKVGKYFDCSCERCEDPTELGSHMSSLFCTRCADNKSSVEGCLVKKGNVWQCINCNHKMSAENVAALIERAKEEMFHAQGDIYHYEILLAKLGRYLHRNHYLMIDLKQNIASILRSIIQNLSQQPGRKVYERKVRLCREILVVLNIIQPGLSRLRAIVLYELSNTSAELYRLRYHEKELTKSELVELLKQTEAMLRESTRMLLYEPIETPEGKLARDMMKELKDLQTDIQLLEKNETTQE